MKRQSWFTAATAAFVLAMIAVFMAVPVFAADGGFAGMSGAAGMAAGAAGAMAPVVNLVDPAVDTNGFMQQVLTAVTKGDWKMLASLALLGIVWALRTFGGKKFPWLATDRGGAFLVLFGGFAGMLATAISAGSPVTMALVLHALTASAGAAGTWAIVKKLFFPADKPKAEPAPAPPAP